MPKIYIKNMVCPRCVLAVERLLADLNIDFKSVKLGEVNWEFEPEKQKKIAFNKGLQAIGFELLEDKNQQLVEKVKHYLIDKVQEENIPEDFVLSDQISKLLLKDYSSVSKLFSQVESITLEHYFITLKVTKIKELLVYSNKAVAEISLSLGYKNASYLSGQFKKEVGMSPSKFRQNFSRTSL